MQDQQTPFICHIFVCLNDRQGTRRSCADGEAVDIHKKLKGMVAARGWKGSIRVSKSGCLDRCAQGPNVMIYPQQIWFSKVTEKDADKIISKIEQIVKEQTS